MVGTMTLNKDFREFVELLNKNDVAYLIVGGYAVAFHGYPRYTKDIDIWVRSDPENAQRLLRALNQFGFGSLGLKEADFIQPEQVIQLGYPPNRIDLLTSLPGVDFNAAFAESEEFTIESIRVRFIGLEALRQCKRAAGRTQDLADLENLDDA